jgi:hypothetical protein
MSEIVCLFMGHKWKWFSIHWIDPRYPSAGVETFFSECSRCKRLQSGKLGQEER